MNMFRNRSLVAVVAFALTGTLLGASLAQQSQPRAPTTLRMGTFYVTLPMLVAQQRGFFERQGLTVQYQQVRSSTQQFQSLLDGEYELIQTSPDNVANYRLNDKNPINRRFDPQLFMGMDYGLNLTLTARPGISSLEQLRGQSIAVDNPQSGFAFALYELLERAGLRRDVDYKVLPVGGTRNRYEAFPQGTFAATLLQAGFETRAANAGYALLRNVNAVVSPYIGVAAAGRESWLRQNRDSVVRFTRAYLEASAWAFDPANREAAIALLMTLPDTNRALAEQLYVIQLQPDNGNIRDGSLDPKALENIFALRVKYSGFEQPQDPVSLARETSGLYDLGYLRDAR
jgi:ABC-type nitrate/sulfonate/bicarbonate transport system substrate-binding protein